MTQRFTVTGVSVLLGGSIYLSAAGQSAQPGGSRAAEVAERQALFDRYCVTCYNERLKTADLELDAVDLANVGQHAELLEKVVRKMRVGAMPPPRPRPGKAVYDGFRS